MKPWGLLAEFESAEALLEAARTVRSAGFTRAEAYAPFDVEGLDEALRLPKPRTAAVTQVGAVGGGLCGYFLQWYSAVVDYPLDVGGRPAHSWPMFIPVTFEMVILGGALAAVAAFFLGSRLPSLDHPAFGAPRFERATRDGFFICLPVEDPAFRRADSQRLLESLSPRAVHPLDEVRP